MTHRIAGGVGSVLVGRELALYRGPSRVPRPMYENPRCELQLTCGRGAQERVKDRRAAARVQVRSDRLAGGSPGDVRPVGSGISELRIDYGPGYRVHYPQDGDRVILLLCGG